MSEPEQTPQEWLESYFFDTYCDECGGDTEHHHVSYALFDLPRAICMFPPDEETGNPHPTISAFKEKKEEASA